MKCKQEVNFLVSLNSVCKAGNQSILITNDNGNTRVAMTLLAARIIMVYWSNGKKVGSECRLQCPTFSISSSLK